MWKYIGYFIIAMIGFVLLYKWKKEESNEIISNARFAAGVLTQYHSTDPSFIVPGVISNSGKSPFVKFEFNIGDSQSIETLYYGGPDISHIPSRGLDPYVGSSFLTIYNMQNPKEARLLFDYPITDTNMTQEGIDSLGRAFLERYKKENSK